MNFDVVLDSESRNVLEIPCLMILQTGPIGPFFWSGMIILWSDGGPRWSDWSSGMINRSSCLVRWGRALVQWSSGMILPALADPQWDLSVGRFLFGTIRRDEQYSDCTAGMAWAQLPIGVFKLNLANFSRIISKLKLNPTLYSNFVNGHCAFSLPN
jgi:hypothetical protein